MTILNTFANQSGQIPLSQLDSNFATPITIGTTPIILGDIATTITGLTLAGAELGTPTGNLANCIFPTLNQNTTGTASNVTGVVAVGNGGTGVTTSTGTGNTVLSTSPTFTGTVSTVNLAYTGTLTGGTGVVAIGTNQIYKDASGNVGIGTTSTSSKLNVNGSTNTNSGIYLQNQTTAIGVFANEATWLGTGTSNNLAIASYGSNSLLFGTNGAERMRIDSSGNLLVGTTAAYGTSSAGNTHIAGGSSQQLFLRHTAATAGKYWKLGPDNGSNNMTVMNNSGAGVYMTDGANTWSSASDERLKTDLIPIENGLDKVNSLRSVTGRFKTDEVGISRSFLIAQDLQAVLPEAVSVQDSRLGTLGVAYTDVIPLLVASIKELKAIIDTQQEQINSLLGK